MREIEVKLKTDDLNVLEIKLNERGCMLSEPIHQHDTIYAYGNSTNEWKQAREGHIVLRIRKENSIVLFTLKQQRSSELDNIEHETEIKNPVAMHHILLTLGYKPEVEVKKIRRKGKLENYEICLDEVAKLGNFVELEKLTDDNADPAKSQEELFQVLESLGLSRKNQEVRGYDTQIYQQEHKI